MTYNQFFAAIGKLALSWVLSLLLLTPLPAMAQAREDLFSASHVSVEARNDNQVEAKNSALRFAKRRALTTIITRLVLEEDQAKLLVPDSKLVSLSEREIDDMLRDVTFEKEKFGGGTYLAELTIRFRPSLVIDYLRHNQVRFSEVRGPKLQVLPFLRLGTQNLLWEAENPWALAWQKAIAPPNQADQASLKEAASLIEFALVNQSDKLKQDVTTDVMNNVLQNPNNLDELRNLINPTSQATNDNNNQQDGFVIAFLALNNFGTGELAEITLILDAPSWRGEPLTMRLASSPDLTRSEFFDRLVLAAESKIQEAWKLRSYVELTATTTNIRIHSKIKNLPSWRAMKTTLNDLPGLQSWQIVALSNQDVWLDMAIKGDMQSFGIVLSRFGYQFQPSNQVGIDYEMSRNER